MTIDYQSNDTIKKATGWVIFLSITLMILGILAILSPIYASAFFTAVMGWFTLISGVIMVAQSIVSKPVRGFWLNLIVGILYIMAGIYILFNLAAAVAVLTLTFGMLFIAEGIYSIIMGFVERAGLRMAWLVVVNGMVTLLLGILVLNRWPSSALWLIGLYVGISLFFTGTALLTSALEVRRNLRVGS
jgi:uncharacterized membrane protein HdeD (DUF308 family)